MITNAFEIALVVVVENLRFWKTFKHFSKQQGGKKKKEVGPNYNVLPWNIDL